MAFTYKTWANSWGTSWLFSWGRSGTIGTVSASSRSKQAGSITEGKNLVVSVGRTRQPKSRTTGYGS